ncbi:hypothetical protein EV1_025182 [Malus domestica]
MATATLRDCSSVASCAAQGIAESGFPHSMLSFSFFLSALSPLLASRPSTGSSESPTGKGKTPILWWSRKYSSKEILTTKDASFDSQVGYDCGCYSDRTQSPPNQICQACSSLSSRR